MALPLILKKITRCNQWRIQRFFGNTVFNRVIQGRSPKWYNRELWTTVFSYKLVWMTWVGVIYYGKCNYYALINCIRHCVTGEFIQIKIEFIKIFSFLLIWNKNLGSHTGWPVAKPLWIRPWYYQWKSKLRQNICTISLENTLAGYFDNVQRVQEKQQEW